MTREQFKQALCTETGIKNQTMLGETDDTIGISLSAKDTETKQRVKDFMRKHGFKFESNNDRYAPLIADMPSAGNVHEQEVTYIKNTPKGKQLKVIISVMHDED